MAARVALRGAFAAVGAVACASEGTPPGGPVDEAPPALVETEPADRAVNATSEQAIRLRFDEPIGERSGSEIGTLILVNPETPVFDIRLEDETITLSPDAPLADGVTYMVTILPGLEDRDGNRTTRPRTILFSVGGERPITLSIVRATIVQDSLPVPLASYHLEGVGHDLDYTVMADSQGRIEMEGVAYGRYEGTAWLERVRPDGWQITDEPGARDTFELSVDRRAHDVTYRIAVVDTTAPFVLTVETPESRMLRIMLDDPLASDPPVDAAAVRLWEAEPDLAATDIPLDSMDLEDVRARRIAIAAVERRGASELEVVPAEPLRKDRVYRVELAVENASGLPAEPEGGRTFRPLYEGPAVWPAERLPWEDPAAPPPAPPPAEPEDG